MDYPAPDVRVTNGQMDFSNTYGVGVGEWDKFASGSGINLPQFGSMVIYQKKNVKRWYKALWIAASNMWLIVMPEVLARLTRSVMFGIMVLTL